MQYRLSDYQASAQECPQCMFSMEYLRDSALLDQRTGYLLNNGRDSTAGWGWFDLGDSMIISLLFGSISHFLWYCCEPLMSRFFGNRSNRRYRKLLAQYPNTLVCTHCRFIIKRK